MEEKTGDGDESAIMSYAFASDAVTHVTLPGHFPRPGPDLGGARGIATGVAGGRGVQRKTIAGVSDRGRKRSQAEIEPDHNLYNTD